MRAINIENDHLTFTEVPDPEAEDNEVIVAVEAIGVNHADLLQRKGKYPPPPGASSLLGLEVAGTIIQTGSKCKKFHKGDRVMCLLEGGGYAEKVAAHEGLCIPIPHNLTFQQAAAIPEAFLTAYQALFVIGELQPKSWILIHAGGSGVSTAALQLARTIDTKAIVTTRSKEKIEHCLSLGAHSVINSSKGSFAAKVLEITEGHGADLIIDFIGAPYFEENIESLSKGGAIVFLSTLGGSHYKDFDLTKLMQKWATLTGTTLRNRPLQYKEKLIKEFSKFALSRLESNELKPVIHTILSWEQAEEAHDLLTQNKAFGKVILSTKTKRSL